MILELPRKKIREIINDNSLLSKTCLDAIKELSGSNLFPNDKLKMEKLNVKPCETDGQLKKNIGKALIENLRLPYKRLKVKEFFKDSSVDLLHDIYTSEDELKKFVKRFSTE
jgi:hypothetical protein